MLSAGLAGLLHLGSCTVSGWLCISNAVGTAGDEITPSGDAMVAGRSLDEWSERLFPDVSMRVTDAYDEDSPYSRAVQVPPCGHQLCAAAAGARQPSGCCTLCGSDPVTAGRCSGCSTFTDTAVLKRRMRWRRQTSRA